MENKSEEEKAFDNEIMKIQFGELLQDIQKECDHNQSRAVTMASGTFNAFAQIDPEHMFSALEIKELLNRLFEAGQSR